MLRPLPDLELAGVADKAGEPTTRMKSVPSQIGGAGATQVRATPITRHRDGGKDRNRVEAARPVGITEVEARPQRQEDGRST